MAEIVVFTFPGRQSVLDAIEYLEDVLHVKVKHSAVIAKAEDGEVTVLEDDMTPNEGAIAGGTLGALLGSVGVASLGALLIPGVGALVAIGAGALLGGLIGGTTGGVAASLLDLGVNDAKTRALVERLNAGAVALIVEVEGDPEGLARLHDELKSLNAEILT